MAAREKMDCWYREGYAAGWLAAINEYARMVDKERIGHQEAYEHCVSHFDDTLSNLTNDHTSCAAHPKDIPPIPTYRPLETENGSSEWRKWRHHTPDWPPKEYTTWKEKDFPS